MIRLNDINKTVIDEKKINTYGIVHLSISLLIGDFGLKLEYETDEARDKDIELLDKIFDVKDIEDKANAYPDEIDALKFAMSGIKKECEPVKKEYITWEEVAKQSENEIKVKLSNGDIKKLKYDNTVYCGSISINNISRGNTDGYIYDEDLFNALMLKKVE